MKTPNSELHTPHSNEWTTHSPEETQQLGVQLAKRLNPGDVLVLTGEIGAGKTTLVQGIAKGLGVESGSVASPTFVLVREYPGRMPIYHADLFRLDHLPDAEMLGLDEYYESDGVTLIEWGRQIPGALPEDFLEICFEVVDPSTRKLKFIAYGAGYKERDFVLRATSN
jgi:tRNA threonylcarbamoyladenosine biosynthesis protein TsaE